MALNDDETWPSPRPPSRPMSAQLSRSVATPVHRTANRPPASARPTTAAILRGLPGRTTTSRRTPPPAPKVQQEPGTAIGDFFQARLEEERRIFRVKLSQANAQHEAAQRELQRLRLELASAATVRAERKQAEITFGMVRRELGRAAEGHWRRIQEVGRDRDAARSAAQKAADKAEQARFDILSMRAEMEQLTQQTEQHSAELAAAAAAESRGGGGGGGADWESGPVGAAVRAALMVGAGRPAVCSTSGGAATEKALLAELGSRRSGRDDLRDLLRNGNVLERVADALWPSIQALAPPVPGLPARAAVEEAARAPATPSLERPGGIGSYLTSSHIGVFSCGRSPGLRSILNTSE